MSIGLFYSTEAGSTQRVAESIKSLAAPLEVEIHDIASTGVDALEGFQTLIFGIPTMGAGELSEDWEAWVDELAESHLSGKRIALFGLGDQEAYPDTFVDGLGLLYEAVEKLGATIVGSWPTDGYDFDASLAVRDGAFVGLVIDEDNQSYDTETRIKSWVEAIASKLA